MALQPYELRPLPGSFLEPGVAIVCTVTGRPLPVSVNWFGDLDDAEAWLQWMHAEHSDPRAFGADQLAVLIEGWRKLSAAERERAESA